ncbi:MAG TPA: DUF4388 domain-containing protein [Chloroflexota bacterium]
MIEAPISAATPPVPAPDDAIPAPAAPRFATSARPRVSVPLVAGDTPTDSGPDLKGRLRSLTLSDILQLLAFGGQTGTLTLEQGWNSRTLTFERGRITYIASATRLATLPQLLLAAGRVDPEVLDAALAAAAATDESVGEILLRFGEVEEADLRRCRDQQLEETIYSLFLWRSCRFAFESDRVVRAEGGIAVDLASERLIMDGTRRVDEWIAISPSVPSVRMIYARAGHSRPTDPVEAAVHELLDGRHDVASVAGAAGMTQFEVACALHRMVQAGQARAIPPDKVKIIELFSWLVESIHVKLMMFGHSSAALLFERELNRFAADNDLKVRMRGGRVALSDLDTPIASTALIDLYRLFIAIQNNHFDRRFEPEIVHGLVQGLYMHVGPELQDMMRMYEFVQIEGLLGVSGG